MEISTQTLILVGNADSVSDVNKEIVKETLKYMFKSSKSSRAYCLAAYGHEMETAEEYSNDYTDLCIQAEEMQYDNKETSLIDTLTQVLSSWEEADYACRDIVVFTNGLDADSLYYDREELFYTIENTNYPIYIVDLVQDNNIRARKNLSAISKTSGGKLFLTEYEGSDAQIEKEIGNGLFSAMDEYAKTGWQLYEENDEEENYYSEDEQYEDDYYEENENENLQGEYEENIVDVKQTEAQGRIEDYDEGIVYADDSGKMHDGATFLAVGIVGIILTAVIAFVFACVIFKKKKENRRKDAHYKEIVEREVERRISKLPSPDTYDKTVFLGNTIDKCDEYQTRLLFKEGDECSEISFEDVNDPSKFYSARINESITVGRVASLADVCIDYDDSVSARHFEIKRQEERYYISDLGSSNGTYLNNKIVNEPTAVYSGDMITIGMITLIVRF